MWKPNYGETEVSPYYQNETIQNAALPDGLSGAICDYVSSRFLSKSNVDTLINDLAKEISAYVNDEYIEHVEEKACEVLAFRLRELVQRKIESEFSKNIELIQKRYIGLLDEEFVKDEEFAEKVLSFAKHNKNE